MSPRVNLTICLTSLETNALVVSRAQSFLVRGEYWGERGERF